MKKTNIRKLAMAAVLVAVAVVGSLFSFPFLGAKCSPVQHLVNIIGGVYLGPWYSLGVAFCASLLRNIFGLGSLMAFPGSMVGAFLSGVMFHWIFKGKPLALRLPMAYVGELFGTSVIGGMLSFPIAYLIMNNTAATLFGFVFPFFASSVVGTVIAAIVVTSLKRVKAIDAFDKTKLSVHTRAMGLAGIEVYDLLRDEYDIQIEFGDIGNILAIITGGDRALEIERLLGALNLIKKFHGKSPAGLYDHEYIDPILEMSPQAAFYAEQETLPIEKTAGRVCSEFVMCYPPGIPILAPGERITQDILDYIAFAKEKGCSLTGCRDMNVEYLQTVKFSAGNDRR